MAGRSVDQEIALHPRAPGPRLIGALRRLAREGRIRPLLVVLLAVALTFPLDGPVHRFAAQHFDSHEVRLLARGITGLGSFWMAGAMLGGLALVGHWTRDGGLVRVSMVGVAGVALGGVANYAVKQLTCRARPRTTDPATVGGWGAGAATFFARWPCLAAARYQSFPSGHTNTAFALAAALAVAAPARRRLWLGVAAAIAASRLVLHAHFLSDVVAGGLLGWTTGTAAQAAASRLSARRLPAAGTAPPAAGP